jgi:signal transduction histidine kinase
MSGEPLPDLREDLARITRRLDDLATGLARLAPAAGAPPAGEPLSESERRGLAGLESLLAVGSALPRDTALVLAIDRVIHGAGADCAALFLPTAGGDLVAPVHRGFTPAPSRLTPAEGIVGRALRERETIRAGPAHRAADPLLREHAVEHAVAIPVPPSGAEPLGVLLAGRRRVAAFGPEALEVLVLVADRLGSALAGATRAAAGGARLGEDLDLEAVVSRVAREAARRLGAPRVAVLVPDVSGLRVAAAIGIPAGAPPPDPELPPLASARRTGRPWQGVEAAEAEPLAAFLGAPPRLVVPLLAGEATAALLVAGGPSPLDPEALAELVDAAGRAIANARLYTETVAALAELRSLPEPPPVAVPPPARDFAGLLAVVLARIGLVRERLADPALVADLGLAEEAAWRAAEAIRGLLGFPRGSPSADLLPLDLATVIDAAVEATRRRWPAGGPEWPPVELAVDSLPPVRGSGEELRDAIEHLLANAVEATPPGGTVRLGARWDGGNRVELTVEDSGSGMDEPVRARALEPFFSTRGPGRLGVGLAVAQAVVVRHRGTLDLESAPGRGTIVRVGLPTATGGGPGGPKPAEAPRQVRVLVVEDEPAVREALVALLAQHGHVALGVADAEAAFTALRREAVDAVVTDLALSGQSGLDVARTAKRIQPATAVILISAWPGRLEPEVLREAGVDRVLDKPVGGPQLADALSALLARRRETPA